jgi:Uncharacterized conserved protein
MPMTQAERAELERWIEMIYEKALELGLDPFPVHFEVVPAHVIYELGAYALPARFSHWTFGRDYHVQKTMYEYASAASTNWSSTPTPRRRSCSMSTTWWRTNW